MPKFENDENANTNVSMMPRLYATYGSLRRHRGSDCNRRHPLTVSTTRKMLSAAVSTVWPLCDSQGNGRNSTVTVAYGMSSGVFTVTGLNADPASTVLSSALARDELTVSWFSVSTPRNF